MNESNENINKKSSADIICYNCHRTIDISDLKETTFFKCKKCYTTLIVADYFRTLKIRFSKNRNRWGLFGLILGLFPMIPIIGFVTVYPILFVILFILLNILIILSLYYFKERANDILLGIIFAELGIYANITSLILKYFTVEPYSKNVPDLSLQIYLFLFTGSFLVLFGLRRRTKFLLK